MSTAKLRLRPDLCFSPCRSDGNVAYLVEDRVDQKFWKIGEFEYEVCVAIDGSRTLPEIVKVVSHTCPLVDAQDHDKTGRVLGWLINSGLIIESESAGLQTAEMPPPTSEQSNQAPKSAKPFKVFDPSAIRIPLLSGENLDRYTQNWKWLISVPSLCIAVLLWVGALVMVYQKNQDLMSLGQKLFVPGSQWWWLLAWAILKGVHETGHAVACARVGAKPKGAGVNFMFLAPLPYVDASNLWSVPNKWHRALVGAAGMLFEITLAAIAMIGACTFENPSIRYLCFSIATLGTFTTVAFNGNPLMRYDGYYIFVDLAGRPNLWQDAAKAMKTFFAAWLLKDQSITRSSLPLLSYGIASWTSRMLMLGTMGWGIWMTWDGVGLVLVAFFASLWFLLPQIMKIQAMKSQAKPWTWSGALHRISPKKAGLCVAATLALVLCSFLPSPAQIYWPAIVDYVDSSDIRTNAPGFVIEVLVHDGQGVREGDDIVRLTNPTLELEYLAAQSALRSSEEKCSGLRALRKHAELQAEEAILVSLKVHCDILKNKVNSLVLRAPRDGILLARMSHNLIGSFVQEGQSIGLVVDPRQMEIQASIPQYAWDTVSHSVDEVVSIHMASGQSWRGSILTTLPRTSDSLEWPSLGGIYGGPIAVMMTKDANGDEELKTHTPRLQTRIQFDQKAPTSSLFDFGGTAIMPPPGSLCSVKLLRHNEAVWQTAWRWIKAALAVQLDGQSSV